MPVVGIVLSIGWIAFWLYWLVAAVGTRGRSRPGSWLRRSFCLRIVLVVMVVLLVRTPFVRGHSGAVDTLFLQVVGIALFILGLATAIWARVCLGNNWGMPMTERISPELVTSGPYRFVRHPIYSGILLALLGTALATNLYALIVVVVVAGYFIFSATVEERNMAGQFPTTYEEYKRSSKMLIPFVL